MYINDSEYSLALEMLNPENYTPLLEYYQGKTKELLKCEGYLREIIKEVKDYDVRRKSDTNVMFNEASPLSPNNKWCKLLTEELKNFFKVKEFNIYWQSGMINGMTLKPIAIMIPGYQAAFKSGKEMNLKVHIFLYEELITMANMNEQELMAVILHEVGHNFYYCPLQVGFTIFAMISSLGSPLLIAFLQRFVLIISAKVDQVLREELPALYNIFTVVSDFLLDYSRFFDGITIPLNAILSLVNLVLVGGGNPLQAAVQYGDERGADTFAAMYGYGPDQASALRKFETVENTGYGRVIAKGGTITSIYLDIIQGMIEITALMTLDPHPNNNQRAAVMLKKLRKDLKEGDYPPNVKKDLENEISRMEKAYAVVSKNATSSNVQVRKTWYNVINKITADNSDFREIFKFYFDSFTF